jgi:hypothetical protein
MSSCASLFVTSDDVPFVLSSLLYTMTYFSIRSKPTENQETV